MALVMISISYFVLIIETGDSIKIVPSILLSIDEGKGEANATKRELDRDAFKALDKQPHATSSRWIDGATSHWIVDEIHQLEYCWIPKNSCTKFKTLWYALATNGTRPKDVDSKGASPFAYIHSKHMMASFTMSKQNDTLAHRVIKDPISEWRTFVVIRDPAERLLSGFLHQCVATNWTCLGSHLNASQFEEFIDRVIPKIDGGHPLDVHFVPQHRICGLEIAYPKYVDTVLVYSKRTVANDTLKFLQKHGLESFFEGYGRFGNESLFDGSTTHSTRGDKDDCYYYQKYFDQNLYQKVRRAFAKDMDLFGLEDPEWVTCLE